MSENKQSFSKRVALMAALWVKDGSKRMAAFERNDTGEWDWSQCMDLFFVYRNRGFAYQCNVYRAVLAHPKFNELEAQYDAHFNREPGSLRASIEESIQAMNS